MLERSLRGRPSELAPTNPKNAAVEVAHIRPVLAPELQRSGKTIQDGEEIHRAAQDARQELHGNPLILVQLLPRLIQPLTHHDAIQDRRGEAKMVSVPRARLLQA